MKDELFLYVDKKTTLVTHATMDQVEYPGHDPIKVTVEDEKTLKTLYQMASNNLGLYGKLYKLEQRNNGNYYLKNVYYVYYSELEGIKSLSTTKISDYDNDSFVKCRFVIECDQANDIYNGINGSFLYEIEEKGDHYATLKEKSVENKLCKNISINSYCLSLSDQKESLEFVYDKKNKTIQIKRPEKFKSTSFWFFMSKKYDPTIIFYSAKKIKVTKNDYIKMYNVPSLPKDFDIYSNLPNYYDYCFVEK